MKEEKHKQLPKRKTEQVLANNLIIISKSKLFRIIPYFFKYWSALGGHLLCPVFQSSYKLKFIFLEQFLLVLTASLTDCNSGIVTLFGQFFCLI